MTCLANHYISAAKQDRLVEVLCCHDDLIADTAHPLPQTLAHIVAVITSQKHPDNPAAIANALSLKHH